MRRVNGKFRLLAVVSALILTGCDFFSSNDGNYTGVTFKDSKTTNYKVGEIFDDYVNNGGLVFSYILSNGKTSQINKEEYERKIYTYDGNEIPTTSAFSTAGFYEVNVTKDPFDTVKYEITVSDGENKPTKVNVSSVSFSESNVTLSVGRTKCFIANVLPENATNKRVRWESTNPSIASVDENGVVTALTVGTSTIKVITVDGSKSAICNLTVKDVEFETNSFQFKTYSNDNNTPLTTTTVLNEFAVGKESIKSVSEASFLYAGKSGLKFGNSFNGGKLTLIPSDSITQSYTSKITIDTVKFGSNITTCSLSINGLGVVATKDAGEVLEYTLPSNTQLNTLTISSGNKRMYVSSIVLCVETPDPVSPTSISILSSVSLNTYEEKTLSVSYLPTNCNSNKNIVWSTSDATVVSVNGGLIKGLKQGNAVITARCQYNYNIQATCNVSVKDVEVTSVSLSSTTLSLAVGNNETLTATVSPSNATNKTVTWTSSNTSYVTVNNGVVTAVKVTTSPVTITATAGNRTATCNVTVTEKPQYDSKWTILVYMCGADLESGKDNSGNLYGAATMDLQEMASVSGQPNDVNVVVQAGGAKQWASTYSSVISSSYANRFHLKNKSFVKDSQITKANMGLSSTLSSFIEWGLKTYAAEKVGLILWNHGGAISGCCYDEQYNDDCLTPAELSLGVKQGMQAANYTNKLEFIAYDCCLMQVQDIAGLNSQYAKYMVASQESEWGYGYSYDQWLSSVYSYGSTTTVCKKIVDSFKSETTSAYTQWGETNDQTLSYLNLSNWSTYETAWEDMSSYLSSNYVTSSTGFNSLKTVVNSSQKYGYTSNVYPFDVFDAGTFLTKMKSSSTYKNDSTLMSKVTAAQTAYSNLVSYEWHGTGSSLSTGLSLFFPISGHSVKSSYSTSTTTLLNWRSMCINYGTWYK